MEKVLNNSVKTTLENSILERLLNIEARLDKLEKKQYSDSIKEDVQKIVTKCCDISAFERNIEYFDDWKTLVANAGDEFFPKSESLKRMIDDSRTCLGIVTNAFKQVRTWRKVKKATDKDFDENEYTDILKELYRLHTVIYDLKKKCGRLEDYKTEHFQYKRVMNDTCEILIFKDFMGGKVFADNARAASGVDSVYDCDKECSKCSCSPAQDDCCPLERK